MYGKPATKEEIAKEVTRLLFGNERKHQKPLTISEIAIALNFERMTVYRYKDLSIELGYIKLDKDGIPQLPEIEKTFDFKEFTDKNPILNDGDVADWWQDLQTRKSGKPVQCGRHRINVLQKLCNSLRIRPAQLLIDHSQTEKIMKNFCQMYQEDKIPRGKRKATPESIQYDLACTVEDFCGFNHMTWKRGVGGIMSRKVVHHAQYSDIKFSKEEFEKADSYLKKKYGLDSDEYRWFWLGVESCARATALFNMTTDYTKHTSPTTGKITYFMSVIETKTIQHKGGKWKKWIVRPDTQKSIDLAIEKGYRKIIDNKYTHNQAAIYFNKVMKELYQFLNKGEYFLNHPTHALRHLGAQNLLGEHDFNYGLVAVVGGWNTIEELKKSYGEMPQEKVIELMEKEN